MSFIINPFVFGGGGGGVPGAVFDFQADAGLGLADNDPVATWADQSGNGNDLSQGTSSQRPTFKATAGPGGLPCVRFDGNDSLNLASAIAAGSAYTAFAVIKLFDSNPRTIFSGNSASFQYRLNSLKQNVVKCNVADIGSSTTNVSTSAFQQMNVTWNGTTATFRLAGGADGSVNNAQTITGTISQIGRNATNGVEFFRDDLCMVRLYTSVLSGADIATVEAEILSRWGV